MAPIGPILFKTFPLYDKINSEYIGEFCLQKKTIDSPLQYFVRDFTKDENCHDIFQEIYDGEPIIRIPKHVMFDKDMELMEVIGSPAEKLYIIAKRVGRLIDTVLIMRSSDQLNTRETLSRSATFNPEYPSYLVFPD